MDVLGIGFHRLKCVRRGSSSSMTSLPLLSTCVMAGRGGLAASAESQPMSPGAKAKSEQVELSKTSDTFAEWIPHNWHNDDDCHFAGQPVTWHWDLTNSDWRRTRNRSLRPVGYSRGNRFYGDPNDRWPIRNISPDIQDLSDYHVVPYYRSC